MTYLLDSLAADGAKWNCGSAHVLRSATELNDPEDLVRAGRSSAQPSEATLPARPPRIAHRDVRERPLDRHAPLALVAAREG